MSTRLIVALGYTLSNNCRIRPILKSRLDEALSIYKQTDKILVCGKMPPKLLMPTRCEKITEAEVMKRYLIENNIPELNIIKEEKSTTTFGNAFYSLDFINEQLPSSVLIISNEFHYPLVKYSFNKVLGSKYNYKFHIIPDSCLKTNLEEIER